MTTTATPFVNTPFGVGVIEGTDLRRCFVRFQDGSRRWVLTEDCEFDADQPDWYRQPEPHDIPGCLS